MEGFIKFLGTGGARFVASTQIRATAGIWLNYRSTNLYLDPGPGAIVRLRASGEGLDPASLDGILITHKHLDHANDVNIMIEAMTEGGFRKRGTLFIPEDALDGDTVVLKYVRKYLDRLVFLRERGNFSLKDVRFATPVRHIHPVETYGMVFHLNKTIGLISDTRYFDELPDFYHADYLIVNVLRVDPIEKEEIVEHLALDDFVKIVEHVRPEMAIMTHFGMSMVKANPDAIAEKLRKETGVNVIAAYDGMKLEF